MNLSEDNKSDPVRKYFGLDEEAMQKELELLSDAELFELSELCRQQLAAQNASVVQ